MWGVCRLTGSARILALGVFLLSACGGGKPAADQGASTGGGGTPGATGPGHFALGIRRESLDSWRRRLAEHGVAIEQEVDWPRGGHSLYFRDPAGNAAELITPGLWGLPGGW